MSGDRERLSGPDNAWLQMGRIENLTNITGMLVFEERVAYEELVERLDERLLRFDRFRQRVHGGHRRFRRPEWEFSPGLDTETHVTHVALPEPQDKAALERFVGGLMSRPLDEDRPLWEAYLVEGVGDGNAVVFRINHSVADGFALLSVMLGLVDDPSAVEFPFDGIEAVVEADEGTDGGDGAGGPGAATDTGAVGADGDGDGLLDRARSAVGAAGTAARAVTVAYDLLTRPDEPETSLRGDLQTAKRAAWTDAIDLATVKALGREHDATVNDVMLAATAGAFRRLLVERGEEVADLELRSSVPVNLKPMNERSESLGNYFGLIFLPIPVHTADFGERIDIVHERMDRERAMIEGVLVYLLFQFVGRAPGFVQDWVLEQFEDAATGVVTNVPGPVNALEFAGSEVSDVLVWAPEANDQGLSLSIFSYAGSIRVGVAADAGLIDEPSKLADALERELEERAAALE
ncbi:wax ester/triacylglycerol synthase family O-acyltransferase [Haloglomus litoreum]|uniref:wax ester/triacylglycerol synthase family O-acyltransferase n=1 Tax=Haloglomus litoreum TaxID=3034026 RepID=UPI0023E8EEEF|nr:wax ester/triacylglycerol synthase family O-acyltransferase [Haloglomus sp. DT116]